MASDVQSGFADVQNAQDWLFDVLYIQELLHNSQIPAQSLRSSYKLHSYKNGVDRRRAFAVAHGMKENTREREGERERERLFRHKTKQHNNAKSVIAKQVL